MKINKKPETQEGLMEKLGGKFKWSLFFKQKSSTVISVIQNYAI